MSEKEAFFKALDEFQGKFKVPVAESTLPGFLDDRNKLILAVFRFASAELGWEPKNA